jgi:hypothetical protein
MNSSNFINALFADAEGQLALWRSDTKRTEWAENCDPFSIDGFAEAANADNFNAYFGVCLQKSRPAKATSRGTEAGVSVMPGLWADVDFAAPAKATAKKKPKNYPTEAAAREAVGLMPAEPTVIVQSGGGLHLYWLFSEPLFIDDSNRREAKTLSHRWQQMLRAKLLKIGGFELDSTHDLSRVLRLPGTPHTSHEGFTVGIDSFGNNAPGFDDAPRYDFADLNAHGSPGASATLDFASTPAGGRKASATAAKPKAKSKSPPAKKSRQPAEEASERPHFAIQGVKPIFADENSEPPASKLYNLCEADQKFKRTFDRKTSLESPSEYDMTLANYCINAGWSPEEAAGLLVQFAKRHFADHLPKLLRVSGGWQDYLHRTIGKAYDRNRLDERSRRTNEAIEEIGSIVQRETKMAEEADDRGEDHIPNVDRSAAFAKLSEIFRVKVVGWRQTGIEDETFSLIVQVGSEKREIIIGSSDRFTDSSNGPKRFKSRIYAEAGRTMVVTGKIRKEWDEILKLLAIVVEVIRVTEATAKERAVAIVREHISRTNGVFIVRQKSTRREHISNNAPYIENGVLYVASTPLQEVASHIDKELNRTKFANAMQQAGFSQKYVHGDGATRSYYFQPIDDLPLNIVKDQKFDPGEERKVDIE